MKTPAKVAYVIPTGRYFIAWDNRYMQNIIVIALQIEGHNLVKPLALLANELEAVPNTTANINIKYGKTFLNNLNGALLEKNLIIESLFERARKLDGSKVIA